MIIAVIPFLLQSWGVQGLTGMSSETSATNLFKTKRRGVMPRAPAGVLVPNSYPSDRWQSRAGWKATCTWVWILKKKHKVKASLKFLIRCMNRINFICPTQPPVTCGLVWTTCLCLVCSCGQTITWWPSLTGLQGNPTTTMGSVKTVLRCYTR